jgi:hypothetical protein
MARFGERAWLWRALLLPAVLSALTLRSLFHGGYLLQVDSVFGTRWPTNVGGVGSAVSALEWLGTQTVGGEITGKLYAGGALFAVGAAAMALTRRLPWYAQCLAGLIAMFNPWVYDRMMEGQWGLVVAAAGLFLWVGAWEALQAKPGLGRAALLGAVTTVTVVFSPHTSAMLVLLGVAGAIGGRIWRDGRWARWLAASVGITLALLLYGIVAFAVKSSPQSYATVAKVGRPDFAFFASTRAAGHGLVLGLLGLYGYWGEAIGRFPLATNGWSWWPVTALILVAAAVAGAYLCRRRAWLLVAGLIGLVIAGSTATSWGLDAATHLNSAIPLVGAYREPQKWSVLWLLAIATLAPTAVARLPSVTKSVPAEAVAYGLALAVLLPTGIATARHLKDTIDPVAYPRSWYETAAFMRTHVPRHARVTVLPWHLYEVLPFTNRLAINPAPHFFPGRLLVSGALEIPGRYEERQPALARIGAAAHSSQKGSCSLADAIRTAHSRWVLALDMLDGPYDVAALKRCGFRIVHTSEPGGALVLLDSAGNR